MVQRISVLNHELVYEQKVKLLMLLWILHLLHLCGTLLEGLSLSSLLLFPNTVELFKLAPLVVYTYLVLALSAPVLGLAGLHSNAPLMPFRAS